MTHSSQGASDQYASLLRNPAAPLPTEFVQSASRADQLPQSDLPEVCFVGRSNVGKSSLLNYFAGQKQLARVSQTPGRTRLLNLFLCRDPEFHICDLPGYGFAKVAHREKQSWTQLMSDYFTHRRELQAFFFLVDCRRQPNAEDLELFSWLQSMERVPIVLATKADKLHKSKWIAVRKTLSASLQVSRDAVIPVSALGKIGLPEVKAALWGALQSSEVSNDHDPA